MDLKDIRKLSAEYNSLKLFESEETVKFLKILYNEAIDECIDSIKVDKATIIDLEDLKIRLQHLLFQPYKITMVLTYTPNLQWND